MERGFSKQSDAVRVVKRNRMTHESLDAHLQKRCGLDRVETHERCHVCVAIKEIVKKADSDKTDKERNVVKQRCLCHCTLSEISPNMKTNCKQAYTYTVNNPYTKEINSDEDDDEDVSPTQTENE